MHRKIALILLLIIPVYFLFSQDSDIIGKPFLITFKDLLSGKIISTEDYNGKITVVVFWFSECPPCRDEIPEINLLYNQYHDKAVEFIGINLDSDIQQMINYCKDNNVIWPQYCEEGKQWDTSVVLEWDVNKTPTVFLLDADAKVISIDARTNLEEKIIRLLDN